MKMIAVAALAEEIGRAALPSPLIATLIATAVLCRATGDAAKPWLERIVGGDAASLAGRAAGSWLPTRPPSRRPPRDGFVLKGRAPYVQDARKVAFFLVAARAEKGVGLFAVPGRAGPRHPRRSRRRPDAIKPTSISTTSRRQGRGRRGPGAGAAWSPRRCPRSSRSSRRPLRRREWQLQTTAEYAASARSSTPDRLLPGREARS